MSHQSIQLQTFTNFILSSTLKSSLNLLKENIIINFNL